MANVDMGYNLTDFWDIFDLYRTKDNDGPIIDELEVTQFLSESSSVRNVFPEEVWLKILDRVTAPDDLLCLSNSSTYFRQILKDERVTFLFPQVVEGLAPQYEQSSISSCYREEPVPVPKLDPDYFDYYPNEDSDYYFTSEDDDVYLEPDSFFEEGQWHHFSGRQSSRCRLRKTVKYPHYMTGIMKCRLVCVSWNKAIETHYQKSFRKANQRRFRDNWEVRSFNCGNKRCAPRRFMEHFNQTHNQPLEKKNPFLGRSVEICGSPPRQCERGFMANLNRTLVAFGEEIWYCTIIISVGEATENENCAQMYLRLREWLQRMPNLKTLIVKSEWDNENHPIIIDTRRLVEEIGVSPMPTLEHLELLKVNGIPAHVSNELIRANNHIYGLQLKRRRWTEQVVDSRFNVKYCYESGYKFLGDLNRLKKLEIVPFWEDLIESDREFAPYLETLNVRCFTESSMVWERELKVIGNKWGGCLKELVLKTGSRLLDQEEENILLELNDGCKPKFEKLERLTIYLYQPIQLDFLLALKSNLKWIGFVVKYVQEEEGEEEEEEPNRKKSEEKQNIEFFGFEDCMEKSNIWNIFTELKMIQVKNGMQSDGDSLTLFKRPRK